jgi:methyl-accepting chemotaxis protein WspA
MRHLGIAGKIWLTIGIFAGGVLLSLGISQVESLQRESRLRITSEVLFPAAQTGQQAEAAFEQMTQAFQEGVLLEDESALDKGQQQGLTAAAALTMVAALPALDPGRATALKALGGAVAAFAAAARAGYAPLTRAAGSLTPEMTATSRRLADETAALKHAVADASRQLAADLRGELADAVRASALQRWISLGAFLAALAVAFVCGYFLVRAIARPLGRLIAVLDAMRTGDLSGRLIVGRGDEFGILATGFNRMTDELAGLVGQIQESGLQVNASVTEIAATAKEQQATASEIAVTTTEIGATSREISVTSKKLVNTMNDVAAVAEQSAVLAGLGQTGLTHMEDTMRRVMEAAGSINAKLAVLSTKAGNISQVVTTITKVADQTNLLSLNAAIEAEKAGEYGRGFAVVATEIRRLADQTAVATYDIDQMVKEIQSAVAAGVMGMDKFSEEVRRGMEEVQQVGGQLSQVILQVQALAPRVESVNSGMEAQASGAEQITQALTQLSEAAQQTVDSLRNSGRSIDELTRVAIALRGGVSRFTLQAA